MPGLCSACCLLPASIPYFFIMQVAHFLACSRLFLLIALAILLAAIITVRLRGLCIEQPTHLQALPWSVRSSVINISSCKWPAVLSCRKHVIHCSLQGALPTLLSYPVISALPNCAGLCVPPCRCRRIQVRQLLVHLVSDNLGRP